MQGPPPLHCLTLSFLGPSWWGAFSTTSYLSKRTVPRRCPGCGPPNGQRWLCVPESFSFSSKDIMAFYKINRRSGPSGAASSSGPVEGQLLQSQQIDHMYMILRTCPRFKQTLSFALQKTIKWFICFQENSENFINLIDKVLAVLRNHG